MLIGRTFGNEDGHARISRGERFIVAGGDGKSHEKMQEIAMKFEKLTKGQDEFSGEQMMEIIRESGMTEIGSIVGLQIETENIPK